jgi:hypothetical protein
MIKRNSPRDNHSCSEIEKKRGKSMGKMHKRNYIKFLTLTALVAATLGCTTVPSDKRPEGVVVERNKQVRPAWVDSPSDRLLVNSTETRFHHSLLKQRDLAIAVSQSQTQGIGASFDLWLPGFNQRLEDIPQLKGLRSSPRTSAATEELLSQVAHKIHSDVAKVEDIYYERVRIDNFAPVPELQGVVEYFDVHTLVQLLSVDGENLQRMLSAALLGGKFPEMKKVGKELAHTQSQSQKGKHH